MKVTYQNTRRDFLRFSLFTQARQPSLWIGLALFIPFTTSMLSKGYPTWMTVVLESFLVVMVFVLVIVTVVLKSLFGSAGNALSVTTLTLEPDLLTEVTDESTVSSKWTSVRSVVRTKALLIVYLTPQIAHLVPRGAVSSEQEWDRLYETARNYHAAARLTNAST